MVVQIEKVRSMGESAWMHGKIKSNRKGQINWCNSTERSGQINDVGIPRQRRLRSDQMVRQIGKDRSNGASASRDQVHSMG